MPISVEKDLNRLRWEQHHQKMMMNSYYSYPRTYSAGGLDDVYMRRKQLNKLIRRTEKIHKFICLTQ
jgi:hypothetical protein